MANDVPEVADFLTALGYTIASSSTLTCTRASRARAGKQEGLIVWAPQMVNPPITRENTLAELSASAKRDPGATKVVILPNLLAFGAPFQTGVKNAGGEIRAYAHFFDEPFAQGKKGRLGLATGSAETEDASELARSLIKPERLDEDLLLAILPLSHPGYKQILARPPERVPQPYFIREGLQPPDPDAIPKLDLFNHLREKISHLAERPEVFMIVAPAGAGKTYLLEARFTYRFESFMLAKSKQQLDNRPIPVLPQSLLRAKSYSPQALFNAIAETECAGVLTPEGLDHLVRLGRLTLMIDGLDEFFAEQKDFFAEMQHRYIVTESKARIFIVLRDSLLTTSPNVRNLVADLDDLARQDIISFNNYQLALWDKADSKRTMAWLRLEKRRPRPSDVDEGPVGEFLGQLQRLPIMNDLARLPYYCEKLLERFIELPNRALPDNPYDLLEYVLDKLIKREWAKHDVGRNGKLNPEELFLSGADAFRAFLDRLKAAAGKFVGGTTGEASVSDAAQQYRAQQGEQTFRAMLEEAAYYYRRIPTWASTTGDAQKPRIERILEELYGEAHPSLLTRIEGGKGLRILLQFGLFTQGAGDSTAFTHEIMADYLSARYAIIRIRDRPAEFSDIVGAPNGQETDVFSGFIRRELESDPDLVQSIHSTAHAMSPAASAILPPAARPAA